MVLPWRLDPAWPELSDVIFDVDPETLARRPVDRDAAIAKVRADGNAEGARILAELPARDGAFDPDAVDRLLVASHYEIQRLALELQQGPRMAGLVRAAVAAVRAADPSVQPVVVDVGCGIGYVLRWMAAFGGLDGVKLVGADFNPALIAEARRLAALEDLRVEFVHANAFAVPGATIYVSSGVIHHIPAPALPGFFAAQAGAWAALHVDFQPSAIAPYGAWLFHEARMRLPLARHDGVQSAVRAHPADVLAARAREGLPAWDVEVHGRAVLGFPRAMHALCATRPAITAGFRAGA
jgi:SAM-dependent methyltransferase